MTKNINLSCTSFIANIKDVRFIRNAYCQLKILIYYYRRHQNALRDNFSLSLSLTHQISDFVPTFMYDDGDARKNERRNEKLFMNANSVANCSCKR